MKQLNELVEISRFYGNNLDFTIGGGGNTSYKDQENIYVKASGIALGSISVDGFAVLDRSKVRAILGNSYSEESNKREAEIKDDLMAASIYPEKGLRPSVETNMHEFIDYDFVVHMHPYAVNALLCSKKAKEMSLEILGEEALYIEYIDPGYVLSKKVEEELLTYRLRFPQDPKIILLENHGIFVSANSVEEIRKIYDDTMARLRSHFAQTLPAGKLPIHPDTEKFKQLLPELFENHNLVVAHRHEALAAHFYGTAESFAKIAFPLIPDQIVYCRAYPIYIGDFENIGELIEKLHHEINEYREDHPYDPKILVVKGMGVFGMESSKKSAELALDVFEDWMKISILSENFGGPHFLNKREINFIDTWEVENYRRKVSAGS
ncbi:class II aldolase/adducin family protein [Flammeovirgaceae bacterium SG7u.111]|nr:class II aldolase/adducin family protein [Flammeovirgaceae bacterium SG7u.132]WPO34345.1 class II aldolase/adducin family protein [Flammeovirgaceae bacterium SG7u.111]